MPLVTLPDRTWVDGVGPVDGLELVPWDLHASHPRADEIEVVIPPYLDSAVDFSHLARLPRLALVQLLTAGYDNVAPSVPPGVRLSNAAGVHDASTAELALALTLASLRGIPDFVVAQQESSWLPIRVWPALADKQVLVVGYGNVGRAIVQRLLPFEVDMTVVASTARPGDELVARVHGIDELSHLLPEADVVILIVPLTPATTGLVNATFLTAMKDGSLLVNVARGKVVDTAALVAETGTGRLRAALDVTDPEPLPAGHPLWSTPGVLIAPHVGGASSAFLPRALRLVRSQLIAYASGGPVAHVVSGEPSLPT
ncbi:MAG: 2-hydroxyacid dehydrogenase [Lapillicoccus sp.]